MSMRNIILISLLLLFMVPVGIYFFANSGYSPAVFCIIMFSIATILYIFMQDEDINFDSNIYSRWILY